MQICIDEGKLAVLSADNSIRESNIRHTFDICQLIKLIGGLQLVYNFKDDLKMTRSTQVTGDHSDTALAK